MFELTDEHFHFSESVQPGSNLIMSNFYKYSHSFFIHQFSKIFIFFVFLLSFFLNNFYWFIFCIGLIGQLLYQFYFNIYLCVYKLWQVSGYSWSNFYLPGVGFEFGLNDLRADIQTTRPTWPPNKLYWPGKICSFYFLPRS